VFSFLNWPFLFTFQQTLRPPPHVPGDFTMKFARLGKGMSAVFGVVAGVVMLWLFIITAPKVRR
jgi:hypothetical protein